MQCTTTQDSSEVQSIYQISQMHCTGPGMEPGFTREAALACCLRRQIVSNQPLQAGRLVLHHGARYACAVTAPDGVHGTSGLHTLAQVV